MIRTVILGIGNSASALIQGLEYYKNDINKNKINNDISKAIFTSPNNLEKFIEPKDFGIVVEKGILEDELNTNLKSSLQFKTNSVSDFHASLTEKNPDIVLNLISSGLNKTSETYAKISVDVGSNFINSTPTSIATNESIVKNFNDNKLIVVGDDLMSQFGGTAFHKGIMNLMHERGIHINESYQLDVGGGLETNNTLDEDLRKTKRNIKSHTIESELPYEVQTVSGTTDYVDFMGNSRTNYFWIEGESFLGSKIKFDIYLRSTDGPNAGGLLFDILRGIQYSKDMNESGNIEILSNFGFKSTLTKNELRQSYQNFSKKYVL